MENISLVTYKDVYLFNDDLGKDGFGQAVNGTNVHEMAHTYFGDLITMRHFEHVWLKESWATYIDYCYYEDHYSHDEARLKSFTQMEGYISETARYMRPIVCRTYNSSWDLFDAHTYPGGAFRLHMLRWTLGDDAFWAAIKTYTNTFAGKSVETEDFKRVLEQQSGLNLTKFFDQWIYGRGYVKLKAEHQYDADKRMVQITLEQTQADKTLEVPSVFEVTIEVDVMDARGEVYTTEVTFTDSTGPKVVAFVAIGDAKPTVVEIDPRGKVLHTLDFNPGEAILEGTAKKGIEVTSRIRAYRQLIKNGGVSALRKVAAALPQEPFYGVRAAVYTALENAKTQAAVDILAHSLTVETDPRALRVLALSCSMKDAAIRTGLLAVLTTKPAAEVSPRTRRFAYTNLGRQQNPEDAAFLIKASESASTRDIHNLSLQGVLLGLGHHRSQEALQQLHKLLFEAKMPENTLVGLVTAYATVAMTQHSKQSRKDACENLAQLVRAHPAPRVRKASIRALVKMGDDAVAYKSVCEAVAAVSFAEQDTAELVTAVRTIGGAKNVNDLQKTVEELESKIKKVEAVVSLLEAREKEAKEKEAKEKEAKEKEAKEKEGPKL
ncbi:hypothetical protein HDU81_011180 [Chytriomyces hyalinus]|nr:hypothetical protein HDU81_011180 [Chytriomyces hyalinus]